MPTARNRRSLGVTPATAAPDPSELTMLLRELRTDAEGRGSEDTRDRILSLLYDELRALASSFMRHESPEHTLQPTALVHEAFLRLANEREASWQDKAHFMALAGTAMRRVLVDHARARGRHKRGGGQRPITLKEDLAIAPTTEVDLPALDGALQRLAAIDERQARVVELRFFAGLSIAEAAEVLRVSSPTVKRDWRHAKAWLRREMSDARELEA